MNTSRDQLEQIEQEQESAGNTPRRAIRVDDSLWQAYCAACNVDGVSASERLRAHMRSIVASHKGATDE